MTGPLAIRKKCSAKTQLDFIPYKQGEHVDLQLRDKVILTTGGSRGIGAAIVRAACAEGAACVVVDRSPESAPIAQGRTHMIQGDVTQPATCEHAVREAIETFGRIDALVNNVGVN